MQLNTGREVSLDEILDDTNIDLDRYLVTLINYQ